MAIDELKYFKAAGRQRLVREIDQGAEGTEKRAGIIGEIGMTTST